MTGILGLILVLLFIGLMVFFATRKEWRSRRNLREITAYSKLGKGVGMAVESGQRLHISLGHGGVNDVQGASTLIGLSLLQRIARAASISDRPPVATSGEATQAALSQDTLYSVYRSIGADHQYDPTSGQLSGLTPFSYAVGTLPVIYDQQVSLNVLAGHFGSEIALITDAAEQSGSASLAGSDSLPAQAVLYATTQDPLIGEELYVAGAYTQTGPMHMASLRTQDIVRWVIVAAILIGSFLKFVGL